MSTSPEEYRNIGVLPALFALEISALLLSSLGYCFHLFGVSGRLRVREIGF